VGRMGVCGLKDKRHARGHGKKTHPDASLGDGRPGTRSGPDKKRP
jgi:hypothetical protein